MSLGDGLNLQQVTQKTQWPFKIKTAARMAVAAVPRMATGVATAVTPYPDYSRA